VTEASCTALGVVKHLDCMPLDSLVAGNDHLADALTVLDGLWLIAQIGDDNAHLTTVVCIDGAWTVEHSETTLQRQSTARANLAFIALGQCHVDARMEHDALQGLQRDWVVKPCAQIHASALWGAVGRQWMRTMVHYFNLNLLHVVLLLNSQS